MKIVFVNRFFYPDHSATSQMLTDLAFYLSELGYRVHVVTSNQRYGDPKAGLPTCDQANGVEIRRVSSTRFGRSALIGRFIDYLGFYVGARRILFSLLEPGDILVAKTDPPLLGTTLASVARRRQAVMINWLQDLFPEVAAGLGVIPYGKVFDALVRVRDRSLGAASINVAIGDAMGERLIAAGIAPKRVRVIPNWADPGRITPVERVDNSLRKAWGFSDLDFVVGYSGNLGRAHEFETLLEAAELLRTDSRIRFLFIGGGKGVDNLKAEVTARGLDGFIFAPYQDRSQLSLSLSVADAHLVILRPEMEGLIVPSKIYGVASAARPILFVGNADGELARLVRAKACGYAVQTGDGRELAERIVALKERPMIAREIGDRARAMLVDDFSFGHATARWIDALEAVSERSIAQDEEGMVPRVCA